MYYDIEQNGDSDFLSHSAFQQIFFLNSHKIVVWTCLNCRSRYHLQKWFNKLNMYYAIWCTLGYIQLYVCCMKVLSYKLWLPFHPCNYCLIHKLIYSMSQIPIIIIINNSDRMTNTAWLMRKTGALLLHNYQHQSVILDVHYLIWKKSAHL